MQTMTVATDKILGLVMEEDPEPYSFQLMYMPMNSQTFYNDAYAEVLAVLLTLTTFVFVNVITDFLQLTGTAEEQSV